LKNALKKNGAMRRITIVARCFSCAIVLITVLAVTACGIISGSGTTRTVASAASAVPASVPGLTITGLDDYIGMRIHARGTEDNRTIRAGDRILSEGDDGFNPWNEGVMTSAVITGGTITLNVWIVEMGEYIEGPGGGREFTSTPYTGSDQMGMFFTIWEQDGSGNDLYYENMWELDRAYDLLTITFTNGSAHVKFEGTPGM
jgi:hypothetical protein